VPLPRWFTLENTRQKTDKNTDNTETKHNPEKANNAKHSKTKLPWFSWLLRHSARKLCGQCTVCVSWQAPSPSQTITPSNTRWLNVAVIITYVTVIDYEIPSEELISFLRGSVATHWWWAGTLLPIYIDNLLANLLVWNFNSWFIFCMVISWTTTTFQICSIFEFLYVQLSCNSV